MTRHLSQERPTCHKEFLNVLKYLILNDKSCDRCLTNLVLVTVTLYDIMQKLSGSLGSADMLHFGYDIRTMTRGDKFTVDTSPLEACRVQNYARSVGIAVRYQNTKDGYRFTCTGYVEMRDVWSWRKNTPSTSELLRTAAGKVLLSLREGEQEQVNAGNLSAALLRDLAKHVRTGTHSKFSVRVHGSRPSWVKIKRHRDLPQHPDALPFD